ncbi:hypothetical protein [Pseudomonas fluorescens]|uniref:Uncharacterized protein n=1 Tax=Pseudomonas fluorescens TaxID=294 RepID=A0A5E6XT90_PSEFL|nr:hypothetical protein [Pseudomonas fluorescens]VVN44360.1 hypothetical protein PS655_05683 [Pseudomonas fluorescens]
MNITNINWATHKDFLNPVRHTQLDHAERLEVIYKLKQRQNTASPSQAISLAGATLTLESGSTLERALQPGRKMLQRLCEQAAFKKLTATLKLPDDSHFAVTAKGEIYANYSGKTLEFASAFKLAPTLKDDFLTLVEMAERAGGSISLAEQIELEQWLKFHDFLIPQTAAECSRLTTFMELPPPVAPLAGNYWEMIRSGAENAVTLSADQRNEFRRLIASYLKGQSLLEQLSYSIFGGPSTPFKRSEAEQILERLVSSPIALRWARAYVRDLGWYGAQENQPQSDESLKQLILTSLLLDIHPRIGEGEPRNQVAGFDLYAVEHLELSFADVHTAFEKHLVQHHRITERNAALAAHLLLAEAAPEFLVKDLPATLALGTPQWVEFCRIVAVQETIAPGSTRSMTYTRLHQLSKPGPVSGFGKTLDALAAGDAVIDWAVLNKIITPDDIAKSIPGALEKASTAYARVAATLAETADTLGRPLPTRRSVSLDILKQVAKGCSYLEHDVMFQKNDVAWVDAYGDRALLSPVELHMSNDLATREWEVKNGESIYTAFPRMLPNLIAPDGEFHRQFNRDYLKHMKAMGTHLKQAFCTMPLVDRTRLLKGKVTIFSLRPSVAKLQTPNNLPTNPISSTLYSIFATSRKPTESHKEIEEAMGRYGVVLCCEFEDRMTCYELFTLHGTCRENRQLAALIEKENLLSTSVRSNATGYSLPATVHSLPTNIECYTHGVPPGLIEVSSGVIDKIGQLPVSAPSEEIKGYYQSFYSTEFDPLANFVLKHRPIATYDELVRECWGQTRLEAVRAKREADLDTFLNFVVPFKSCIEDLSSDDVERQVQGAGTCALEAAMTILLVVGAVAQVVSVVAKTMTVATKASALAKVGLVLVNNVFNPLDGLPDLLFKGGKLLRRGFNSGFAQLENVLSDARKWSGTSSPQRHLAATIDPDTIRLADWRPAQASQDIFQVWATRHNDEWFALNLRGEAWGPALKNIKPREKFSFFKLFKRTTPFSYTKAYLKKATPLAQNKLDNTLQLLSEIENDDVRSIVKYVFGTNSDEAINYVSKNLRAMRKDLGLLGHHHMSFRQRGTDTLAALKTTTYKHWKASLDVGTQVDDSATKFLAIYPDNLDEWYQMAKYDDARVGDVLVHEMSHGTPGTLDFYYGEVRASITPAEYDAAGLMEFARNARKAHPKNLANPHHAFANLADFEEFEANLTKWPKLVQDHPALLNAESYSVAVSLIDQYRTHPATFMFNLATLRHAIDSADAGEFLKGPLMLNLANPHF